ncbi:MAG: sugar transferase [Bacillota bacterium]
MKEREITEEILKIRCSGLYNRIIKRIFDFLFALILLIIISPFVIIISIVVAITSGFPIFYRAQRGGYRGKPFKIMKFRSMVNGADKTGRDTTALNDDRITKIGKILRKTKMDEIPQLFNILFGNMSFIGPRPEILKYVENFSDLELYITRVRPGITDFSSLEFINLDEVVGENNADEYFEKHVLKRKNELRVKYVAEVSAWTDIKLFFLTVYKVIEKVFKIIFKKGRK